MNKLARVIRRPFPKFMALTVAIGFFLNEFWEMAQMAAYVETTGQPWTKTLALCTPAAFGDVVILLGLYSIAALASADPTWGLRGKWNQYLTTILMGLGVAALIEHAALSTGRWSYKSDMPVVPYLGAGFWPLLQMAVLPPTTFWLAKHWTVREN